MQQDAGAAHLRDPTGESAGGVPAAIRSHGGVCRRRGDRVNHVRHCHRHHRASGQPALGLGWLGMELGRPADLLQPRPMGRLGRRISATASLVSTSPSALSQPPGVWRQLGLSAAELPAAQTDQSSGNPAGLQPPCEWARVIDRLAILGRRPIHGRRTIIGHRMADNRRSSRYDRVRPLTGHSRGRRLNLRHKSDLLQPGLRRRPDLPHRVGLLRNTKPTGAPNRPAPQPQNRPPSPQRQGGNDQRGPR